MMNLETAIEHCKEAVKVMEDCSYKNEHRQLADWLKELEQYRKAEQEGLLIKLPCKVGDKVYIADGEITVAEVTRIIISKETRYCIKYTEDAEPMATTFRNYNIGWDIFLSEEEAEAALAKD